MFNNLFEFYRSKEWADFRKVVIAERIREDGFIYDEYTNKPIVKAYDIILHHKEELTEENVFDYNVSLNPDNIMIVSHRSHNLIHNKLNSSYRKVYLVYGAPLSGKTSWVKDNIVEGDLVVDMDSIWQCVSGLERYSKPRRLNAVVFKLRDTLLDSVKYRLGKWQTAYIIGGYPLTAERERLCREMGAEEVLIDTSKEECLRRLEADEVRSSIDEYKLFIEEWFERYTAP